MKILFSLIFTILAASLVEAKFDPALLPTNIVPPKVQPYGDFIASMYHVMKSDIYTNEPLYVECKAKEINSTTSVFVESVLWEIKKGSTWESFNKVVANQIPYDLNQGKEYRCAAKNAMGTALGYPVELRKASFDGIDRAEKKITGDQVGKKLKVPCADEAVLKKVKNGLTYGLVLSVMWYFGPKDNEQAPVTIEPTEYFIDKDYNLYFVPREGYYEAGYTLSCNYLTSTGSATSISKITTYTFSTATGDIDGTQFIADDVKPVAGMDQEQYNTMLSNPSYVSLSAFASKKDSVTWTFGGESLDTSIVKLNKKGRLDLYADKLTPANSGDYKAVFNDYSAPNSVTVNLKVINYPKIFVSQFKDQAYWTGEKMSEPFRCDYDQDWSEVDEAVLFFNGKIAEGWEKSPDYSNGVYNFEMKRALTKSDRGTYVCQLSNNIATKFDATERDYRPSKGYGQAQAYLAVYDAPKVISGSGTGKFEGTVDLKLNNDSTTILKEKIKVDPVFKLGQVKCVWYRTGSDGKELVVPDQLPAKSKNYYIVGRKDFESSNEVECQLEMKHANKTQRDYVIGAKYKLKLQFFGGDKGVPDVTRTYNTQPDEPIAPAPITTDDAGFPIWIIIIIAIILLLIILFFICFVCIHRNKGETYPVDEKERAAGRDPEKELQENQMKEFQRPNSDPPFSL